MCQDIVIQAIEYTKDRIQGHNRRRNKNKEIRNILAYSFRVVVCLCD